VQGIRVAFYGGPRADQLDQPEFWATMKELVRAESNESPVFSKAPMVIREEMLFPYLAGALFMRWWQTAGGGAPLPSRTQLPVSTEQVLHPEKYQAGDTPIDVRFADSSADVIYEDTMGELELEIWQAVLTGAPDVNTDLPSGWGGDRFRVYRTPNGPAIVLWTVWDNDDASKRFQRLSTTPFLAKVKAGYRTAVDTTHIDGRAAVRVVRAPDRWPAWSNLPALKSPAKH
jgi:hypothetical protein